MNATIEPSIDPDNGTTDVDPFFIGDTLDAMRKHKTYPPPPPSVRSRRGFTDWRKLELGTDPSLAKDLMTRNLLTIGPDDLLEHLEEHMLEFKFRHLPVVEDDKLLGLISYADLLRASSTFLSDKSKERNALIHQLPAKAIMQRDLTTVRPTATLAEVATLMWSTRVGCIPVTEQNGTLVGLVTEADFIRVAHHFLASLSPGEPVVMSTNPHA